MQLNVLDKKLAIKNFFTAYAHDVNGGLNTMDESQLRDYLESDVFLACASAATGIPDSEFIEFAAANAGKL